MRDYFKTVVEAVFFVFSCFVFDLQEWVRDGDSEDQQLAFEHVTLNMPNRYPNRLVNSQMDIQNLWF